MIENAEHGGRPRCALSLEASPKAVPIARQVLRAALEGWDISQLEEDASLVCSELVDNAVRHAKAITLVASPEPGGQVALEVWDDAPSPPTAREAEPESLGGRGLIIVDALSCCWGWRPAEGGKVVWAVLRTDD